MKILTKMGSPTQEMIHGQAACPDCIQCHMCSRSRCRQCRKGTSVAGAPELGPFLTHGQYLEWKRAKKTEGPHPRKE